MMNIYGNRCTLDNFLTDVNNRENDRCTIDFLLYSQNDNVLATMHFVRPDMVTLNRATNSVNVRSQHEDTGVNIPASSKVFSLPVDSSAESFGYTAEYSFVFGDMRAAFLIYEE